ncbi:MAG TPA: 50S ribosomal protein L25/general stress protein Ctc [Casimicrobiaceae bacterium]|jgi:large subunit ribosomal protein L25
MQQHEFTAFARNTEGRGASRRLRRSGRAPGIVYGGSTAPQPIEVDHNALIHALKREAFHSSILTMKFDGASQRVLLRDVQMHPFRNEILHVDFQRVDESRKIHIKVPLHFTHAEDSPAHKTTDAIISHVLTDLDVSCLPKDLPTFIEVDLAALAVGQSIHVSDLKLPAGVSAVTRGANDPVVVTAIIPRVVVEVEETAVAAEGVATEAAAGEEAKPGDKAAEKGPEKGAEKSADKGSEKSAGKKDDKK